MYDPNDTLCVSACGKARIATMRREAAVEAAPQWSIVARRAPFLHFAAAVDPDTALSCGQRYSANEALWHIYEAGLGSHLFPAVGGTAAHCAAWRSNAEALARDVFTSEAWSHVEDTAALAALREQVLATTQTLCPPE